MACGSGLVGLFYVCHIRIINYLNQKMEKGTISRLTDRGFGFISREGEEKDLFFHSNELQGVQFNELKEGDQVEFEIAESPKGLNAIKVSRVA